MLLKASPPILLHTSCTGSLGLVEEGDKEGATKLLQRAYDGFLVQLGAEHNKTKAAHKWLKKATKAVGLAEATAPAATTPEGKAPAVAAG